MSDILHRPFFQKTSNNPNTTLGQLYSYLKGANRVPESIMVDGLTDKDGNPVNGMYDPYMNQVSIDPRSDDTKGTYTHEMNHAVQQAIDNRLYNSSKLNPSSEESRLRDAWNKIVGVKSNLPLGGNLSPKEKAYRSDPHEWLSFGVGNYAEGNTKPTYPVAPHNDATAATESAILMDLAKRSGKPSSLFDLFR